jgi:glycogen operon protein
LQGVPMLVGGDELGRTQRGNNNAYCQDNEVSWFDWAGADQELLAFTRELSALRRAHPVFRRRGWFSPYGDDAGTQEHPPIRRAGGAQLAEVGWLAPDGSEMTDEHWLSELSRSLQVFLNGLAIGLPDDRGEPIVDDTFLMLFHAAPEDRPFRLPEARWGAAWRRVMDTERGFAPRGGGERFGAGAELVVLGRSVWLLQQERG